MHAHDAFVQKVDLLTLSNLATSSEVQQLLDRQHMDLIDWKFMPRSFTLPQKLIVSPQNLESIRACTGFCGYVQNMYIEYTQHQPAHSLMVSSSSDADINVEVVPAILGQSFGPPAVCLGRLPVSP